LLDFGCVWFFHVGNPGLFLFSIDDVESSILYFCFVVFVFCGYFLVVGNVCLVWCSYQSVEETLYAVGESIYSDFDHWIMVVCLMWWILMMRNS